MSIIKPNSCIYVHHKNEIKIFLQFIKQNRKEGIKTRVYIMKGKAIPTHGKKLVKYYPKYE